jgi:hypothetical protein
LNWQWNSKLIEMKPVSLSNAIHEVSSFFLRKPSPEIFYKLIKDAQRYCFRYSVICTCRRSVFNQRKKENAASTYKTNMNVVNYTSSEKLFDVGRRVVHIYLIEMITPPRSTQAKNHAVADYRRANLTEDIRFRQIKSRGSIFMSAQNHAGQKCCNWKNSDYWGDIWIQQMSPNRLYI